MALSAKDAIYAAAKKYGIRDPHALMAVSYAESGLNPGNIGDGGTSVGLFQLHQGGALGNMGGSQARTYLDAYKNAEFAARQMRSLGIHKLTGRDAVNAIVTRFERPAAPGQEVDRAWQWYQQNHPGGGGGMAAPAASFAAPDASPSTTPAPPQNTAFLQTVFNQNAKAGKLRHTTLPTIQLPASSPSSVSFRIQPDGMDHTAIPPRSDLGNAITTAAKQFLGVKYVWGGTTPKGFDCSGLIQYVFRKFGITTPRVSEDQFKHGQNVPLSQGRAGDLIFFRHADGDVGHVGIMLGNGQFLHAPHTGDVVKISNLKGYGLPVAGVRRYAK